MYILRKTNTFNILLSCGLRVWLVIALAMSPLLAIAETSKFRAQAPANTIFYVDGPLEQMYDIWQHNLEPSSVVLKRWLRVYQYNGSATAQETADFADLLSESLIQQLLQRKYGQLHGLQSGGSFALYFDDLLPVLKLDLPQPQVLMSAIEAAAKQAQLTGLQRTINGTSIKLWRIYQPSQANFDAVYLAAVLDNNVLNIAMVTESMSDLQVGSLLGISNAQSERGLTAELVELAGILGNDEGPKKGVFGRWDWVEMTRILLNRGVSNEPAAIRKRSHLRAMGLRFATDVSAVCEKEILQLVGKTPYAIFGINSVDSDTDNINKIKLSFEVADQQLATNLMTANGVLQSMHAVAEPPLLNLSLGMNVAAIPELMGALKSYLKEVQFACPELEQGRLALRQQLQLNTWLMYSALSDGLQGINAGIYDLKLGSHAHNTDVLDGYLSIYLDNFSKFTSLAQLLSISSLKALPEKGQVVMLEGVDMPADQAVYMTRNEQELRIYTGQQSSAWAQAPHPPEHDQAGIFGFAWNLGDFSSRWWQETWLEGQGEATMPCLLTDVLALHINNSALQAEVVSIFTPQGLELQVEYQEPHRASTVIKPLRKGHYQVARLNSDCQWGQSTTMSFTSNITGVTHTKADSSGCVTAKGTFQLAQVGHEMRFTQRYSQANSCSGTEGEHEKQWSCYLLHEFKNTHICAEPGPDGIAIYRFRALN